uniref:Alpha-tocopherol transfer protein-like n=1 Tax=Cacopsylla melanoneura TaxID=428564 RepID=A0A8D8X432_9HEMI
MDHNPTTPSSKRTSCYYSMDEAKSCMELYFTIRSNTPEFFSNRNICRPELEAQSTVVEYACIGPKTPQGYQIIFHRLHQNDPSKYVFQDSVKLLSMSVDACLHVEGTVPGYIFLFDMAGVRLGHLLRLNLGLLSKFFQYIQEANPVRLKGIHVLNTKSLIDKILYIIKPFMKKELLSLIHFHQEGDISSVYQYIPESCIPGGDLPGELKDSQTLNAEFVEWMKNLTEVFQQDTSYRVDETKRVKSGKKNAARQLEKTQVSLQRLELD